MSQQDEPLHIDIPVKLAAVKNVFGIASLSFEGELPAAMFHMNLMVGDVADWNAPSELIAVFHTNAGHVTLHDAAYNADRNIATGNPYKDLIAAVSDFGGLGSFGAHGLDPNAIEDVIAEIRSLTTTAFAMNLWVSMEDAGARTSAASAFQRALSNLSPHIKTLGGTLPAFAPYKRMRFEDRARALLDASIPVFSFIHGIPPK